MKEVVFALLAALLLSSCTSSGPSSSDAPPVTSSPASTPVARAVVDLTNAERTRAGIATLREEGRLAQAAQIQADQVARAGRLDHDLPGATFPRLQDRLSAVGYGWQATGENLASGQADAAAVVADWMRSQPHRENILNAAFTELGVGHTIDAAGRAYYVQVFARPR
jgi:uncharacterized protein YkwD